MRTFLREELHVLHRHVPLAVAAIWAAVVRNAARCRNARARDAHHPARAQEVGKPRGIGCADRALYNVCMTTVYPKKKKSKALPPGDSLPRFDRNTLRNTL